MFIPAEGVVTYDVPQNAVDVSNLFYEIQMPATRLLNAIGLGNSVKAIDPKWFDDRRLPIGTVLTADYTAGVSTTVSLQTSEGLRVGSLFSIGETVFKATAINHDTHEVTIAVLSGDGNHVSGDEVIYIGNARKQGSARQDYDVNTPISRYNRTQIFDDAIVLTGTQEAVDQYGSGGLNLTLENKIKKKLQRLFLEMGRAVWRNPRVSPSDNTNESVMGGLNWFIGENGQASSGAFSHANISAFVYDLFEMGLLSPEIWINPYDADVYRQLDSTYIQVDAKVTFAGRPSKWTSDLA
ncbi:MAG: DUF5309 domain-containing protein [Spirochaetia bacterium]|nr:DUF5309 domain-containing protein [Spirochaetia bacterium]